MAVQQRAFAFLQGPPGPFFARLGEEMVRQGVRVPEEFAIVGYDDIDFAAASIVPLTSVRQPSHEIGRRAAELLLTALAGDDQPVSSVRFEPTLMPRQSTRPV